MVSRSGFPLAILGHPVGHSLSPTIHNAALIALGEAPGYIACDVRPDELKQAIDGLIALGFRGANVTIPHKEAVLPFMHEVSPSARKIGAVNTIVVDGGRLIGENTDHLGFWEPLQSFGDDLVGQTALVLGAGGAARAVVYALMTRLRLQEIGICARKPGRAGQIVDDLANLAPKTVIKHVPWKAAPGASSQAALVVNTTPIGMSPHVTASPLPPECLRRGRLVYDLVYTPATTRLLEDAERAGARCIGGLPMLLGQAAAAFRLWTGREMPLEPVRRAVLARLKTSD
jgi:shikimate dehydrogenase